MGSEVFFSCAFACAGSTINLPSTGNARSFWVWYISPLVPGMLVYWIGMAQAHRKPV
jgi:hypothetical protein